MTEAEKGACEALIEKVAASKRRLRTCVERWPDCETGEYNPACCRFPKSCSATIYDPDWVSEDDLEPPAEPRRRTNMSTLAIEETQKIADWLDEHPYLSIGLGTRESACSIAAINLALFGELTDTIPDCMSLILGRWIIGVQDTMPNEIRNSPEWRDLLPLAAGTGRGHEEERLQIVLDWMWGTVLPYVQRVADVGGFGAEWRRMTEKRSPEAALSAAEAAWSTVNAAAWAADVAAQAADVARAARAADTAAQAAAWAEAALSAEFSASKVADVARAAAWSESGRDAAAWVIFDPIGLLRRLVEVSDD